MPLLAPPSHESNSWIDDAASADHHNKNDGAQKPCENPLTSRRRLAGCSIAIGARQLPRNNRNSSSRTLPLRTELVQRRIMHDYDARLRLKLPRSLRVRVAPRSLTHSADGAMGPDVPTRSRGRASGAHG